MYKSDALQSDENRAQSADSSKDYSKPTAFKLRSHKSCNVGMMSKIVEK